MAARLKSMRLDLNKVKASTAAELMAGRWVVDVLREVENASKARTPVDTGNLRSRYSKRFKFTRRTAKGTLYTRVNYAKPVHEGSRPHEIRARRKKALRFKMGGQTVIVRKVNHPGNRAQPFMREAVLAVAARHRELRVVRVQ